MERLRCRLSDGRGFEASPVLMAGAYDKLRPNAAVVLKVIDVAIEVGCDIDEPDELGFVQSGHCGRHYGEQGVSVTL